MLLQDGAFLHRWCGFLSLQRFSLLRPGGWVDIVANEFWEIEVAISRASSHPWNFEILTCEFNFLISIAAVWTHPGAFPSLSDLFSLCWRSSRSPGPGLRAGPTNGGCVLGALLQGNHQQHTRSGLGRFPECLIPQCLKCVKWVIINLKSCN